MNLVRRLRRHLSFANVVAYLALFAALGGSAYAASKTLNGKYLVKHSVGGNKLKNEAITSKQIKKNSLSSSVIDLSTLATVPSAQTAVTATSAGSANTANSANTAETASKASSADTATKATSAETASRATSAETAVTAGEADHATNADHATSADDADTLDGETAGDLTTDLTVACPAATELFGGICWDEGEQVATDWFTAIEACSARGGRLPTISELIAYVLQEHTQVSEDNWSGDVVDIEAGNKELVLTSDESSRHRIDATGPFTRHYRCVFYRAN